MEIIVTHENADFDAIASLVAAHKLYPQALPILPRKLNRNVSEFLTLYQKGLPFITWEEWRKRRAKKINRIILVDTQRIPDIRHKKADTPILIIDHHPQTADLPPYVEFIGEEVGAAVTLLVEQIRSQQIHITSLEATLFALGVYSDTGSMTYGTTTPRDIQVTGWLLRQKAVLDTVRRFLLMPLNDIQQTLLDRLIKSNETRNIHGYLVMVAFAHMDHYVEQVNSVTHRLQDILDPDVLAVVVDMKHGIQVVFRSRSDAVDVGAVAHYLGGGGHSRAAAATITDMINAAVLVAIWQQLEKNVKPKVSVADLMSYGAKTFKSNERIGDIITQLRLIGHEGYPVVDDNQRVVGLLTRRQADKSIEQGHKHITVDEAMDGGVVTVKPDDAVSTLEQIMVSSKWGQIPVVDDAGQLIGIVTRTDLIKHWARVHPATFIPEDYVKPEHIENILGASVATLIDMVAMYARKERVSAYLVGGVVRDLLLNRPNFDVDFVIESDAIVFAEKLCGHYGGRVSSYRPFGTAKWQLDDDVAAQLGVTLASLPAHVDFATSRNEFYNHPTALPSVYSSSIKLDLHRRDFTMNTLAIQLSPEQAANRLLDFYGGYNDLKNGAIRVLHSLSFVDDPTRVLRAIRFEHRLGFHIEQRTAELIEKSHPMLLRITGERLRNELKMLLQEKTPEKALLTMHKRGILSAIHPGFQFDEVVAENFRKARETEADWPLHPKKFRHIYWLLIMARVPYDEVQSLGERLLFARNWINSFQCIARVTQFPGAIYDPDAKISQIVNELDAASDLCHLAIWIAGDELQKERIMRYRKEWRYIQPVTNGHTLQGLGLSPGPVYTDILRCLRQARLDGEIETDEAEGLLLHRLINETIDR